LSNQIGRIEAEAGWQAWGMPPIILELLQNPERGRLARRVAGKMPALREIL
jgi:hypothetical protein